MKTVLAWSVMIAVAVAGYFLSAWMVVPVIRGVAAHTSPNAAVLITVLRLVFWLVFLLIGALLASRILK